MIITNYFFLNILAYIINILLFGTILSYSVFFFLMKNQYQNLIKHDIVYNLIKIALLGSLGLSYIFFIFFLYFFYSYYLVISNYSIFTIYGLSPTLYINLFFSGLGFSVDFFGIILLFLGYFVGILSLLSLDNRIF